MPRPFLSPLYIQYPNKAMVPQTAFILNFELRVVFSAIETFDNESTVCNVISHTLGVDYTKVKDFLRTPIPQIETLCKRVENVCEENLGKEATPKRLIDLI